MPHRKVIPNYSGLNFELSSSKTHHRKVIPKSRDITPEIILRTRILETQIFNFRPPKRLKFKFGIPPPTNKRIHIITIMYLFLFSQHHGNAETTQQRKKCTK